MRIFIREFLENESGITFMDYALITSIVSLVGIPLWDFVGSTVSDWYSTLGGTLDDVAADI